MPRANPRDSFDVAVRHLFHHLDDAGALRHNPLVSRLFEAPDGARARIADVRATVELVQRLIWDSARHCCDADLADQQNERAFRQSSILRGCYSEKKSMPEIAEQLGISIRQCYRERAEICRRVAGLVVAYEPARSIVRRTISELGFEMEQAAASAEAGHLPLAIESYGRISRSAGSMHARIDCLCRRAEVEIDSGALSVARATLADARALLAAHSATLAKTAAAASTSHLQFVESRLAWSNGEFPNAKELLGRARAPLERIYRTAGSRVRDLYFNLLIESIYRLNTGGQFAQAQECLQAASEAVSGSQSVAPLAQIDLTLAQVAIAACSFRPGCTSLRQLADAVETALQLARETKSFRRIVLAEVERAMLDCCRYGAVELSDALRILRVARRFGNQRVYGEVAIEIASYLLLSANTWKAVPHVLNEADSALPTQSIERAVAMHLQAAYDLLDGRPRDALACEEVAMRRAQTADNPRLIGAMLRGLAAASFQIGRKAEAGELIEAAAETTEKHGAAESCLTTYTAAARITGSTRFVRAARTMREAIRGQ